MSSITIPNSAWATDTLLASKAQSLGSLEELSLYVARDLEWLKSYKHEKIALFSADKQPQSTVNCLTIVESNDQEASIRHVPSILRMNVESGHPEESAQANTQKSRQPENETDVMVEPDQAATPDCSSTVPERQFQTDPLVVDNLPVAVVHIRPEQAEIEAPGQNIINATIEEATAQIPRESSIPDIVGLNKIPLKIVGLDKDAARTQNSLNVHNDLKAQQRQTETGQQESTKVLDRDYMQPTNLKSPEKAAYRNDSAYFSAPNSPTANTTCASSPRKSIAFASLPPRQPFAKKSLGPRSSQSHASTSEAQKSICKMPAPDMTDDAIKLEADTSPRTNSQFTRCEVISSLPALQSSTKCSSPQSNSPSTKPHDSWTSMPRHIVQDHVTPFIDADTQNPFAIVAPTSETTIAPHLNKVEDDEWLPRFESGLPTPKKKVSGKGYGHEMTSVHQSILHNALPEKSSEIQEDASTINQYDKSTPGPIRAAMQAASAKATSYLRQARTAFGSPTINHTRVFKTTTPMQSPPKPRFKAEPQTPSLYPTFDIPSQAILKPSMIPSKTPRKSPEMSKVIPDLSSPRRSPRRSPKKGNEATHSMAVIAARNASAKTTTENITKMTSARPTQELSRIESPPKPSRLVSKSLLQAKAKPLSIRVATASQREIDQTKERKIQPTSSHAHEVDTTSILSRSTMENGQVEYLSKSQTAGTKRPLPNRQIRALAAANQAKEKAEKEQERREQQKKELEKKRHDVRRQMNEDEKRKNELAEERKRKAAMDSRLTSVKKSSVRALPSGTVVREAQIREQEVTLAKDNRQSVKRALNDTDDNTINTALQEPKRQRVSEQTCGTTLHNSSLSISKPVRVSLQKKSLFGHPGEPGYKKPGTTTMTKPGPVVDAVKFSTEPVRFAVNSSTAITNTNISTTTASITNQEQRVHNLPPSELIELPEINSDYSDSDDEEPAKDAFERPAWAETPELRKLLRRQQKIDPDDVFGPIPPLQMEEIFKGKERALARFRPRSSSANWSGNDKLSAEEVVDYARAMGYKN